MSGRFSKKNGSTMTLDQREAWRSRPSELRRFKPDFYNPYMKPVKSPNLFQHRLEREFGKRIVDQAAKQVAKRAPLALAGPLGDMLALGLIGWDLYLLLLELMNNANPVPPFGDPPPGSGGYDLADGRWTHHENPAGNPPTSSGSYEVVEVQTSFTRYWNTDYPGFPHRGLYWLVPGNSQFDPDPLPTDEEGVPGVDSIQTFYEVILKDSDGLFPDKHGYYGGEAYTWYDPAVDPTYTIGYGAPLPMDLPLDWAEPDPNMKRNFFPDGIADPTDPVRDPEEEPKYKRGPRFRPPRPTKPDRKTRERKAKGPLGQILKILDIVSEASEWVGALYDALPEETKRDWEALHADGHYVKIDGKWKWITVKRGLLDNAGQYGIDGADWRLGALWHNWHKVDIEKALKNIIANELQDKILGMYQRSLPKNIGHVGDAGSLALNDLINLFNDTIGLSS